MEICKLKMGIIYDLLMQSVIYCGTCFHSPLIIHTLFFFLFPVISSSHCVAPHIRMLRWQNSITCLSSVHIMCSVDAQKVHMECHAALVRFLWSLARDAVLTESLSSQILTPPHQDKTQQICAFSPLILFFYFSGLYRV